MRSTKRYQRNVFSCHQEEQKATIGAVAWFASLIIIS